MIKGILFDFDGVLTKRYVSAYHMYQWIVDSQLKEQLDSLLKEEMVQRCMLWDQFGYCDKSYVLENMKKNWFPDMDVNYWKNEWYEKFESFQVLSDCVEEVLKELKKHYLLGVLSNGSSKSQHAKLHHTGLEKYFDCVVVSGDYGIDKPDPEIFQIACDKLGTKLNETAMVGDTFFTDISGAIKAGLKPVWYCYERKPISEYKNIDVVHDFCELKEYFLK